MKAIIGNIFLIIFSSFLLQKFDLSLSAGDQPDFVKLDKSDEGAMVALTTGGGQVQFEVRTYITQI